MEPSNNTTVSKKRWAQVAGILLLVLALGFLGGWLGSTAHVRHGRVDTSYAKEVVAQQSELIAKIADDVGPSVVSINVTSRGFQNDPFFSDQAIEEQSAGTGFIISDDGYIITNRHVVPKGAQKVSVTLSDGTELTDVTVVGRTNSSDPLDIAFLKVNDTKGKKLKAVRLGDSSKTKVGEMVVAIGNALGQFQNTVTSGIVSGYGRNLKAEGGDQGVESLQNLFQTDAAINAGNSGGPLVNASGEVVGINTAVAGGGAQNIGFAIPINDAKGLVKSVLEKGKLERPYLGVRYVMLTDDLAYQFNVDTKRGAYIVPSKGQNSIISGSPAAKAGLQEKDIIIKINDTELDESNSLTSVLGRYSAGDTVKLTVLRGGKEMTVYAKLASAPSD